MREMLAVDADFVVEMSEKTNRMESAVKRNRLCAGMTLAEVMVALFVFSICIAGTCTLVYQTKRLADRARDHYTAINIGKNRLEKGRGTTFNLLTTLIETNVMVDRAGNPGVAYVDATYRRSTSVGVAAGSTNLIEMIVTVEVLNRKNWRYTGEKETIRSYFANLQ